MNSIGFTICAYNYLSKALALSKSFKQHNPNKKFYIYIVGKKQNVNVTADIRFVEDLAISDFDHYSFKYDVIEFSTFLKPFIMKNLLNECDRVYYIDPDIMLFNSFDDIDYSMEGATGVLTPHTFKPIDDGAKPSDLDFSRFGSFNLGFIGLNKTTIAFNFLNWWSDRLSKYGFYDPQSGMAVDQKWIDLGYVYFSGFKIINHLGCNVAFWNLHERQIAFKNGQFFVNDTVPLIFIHFSSYNSTNTNIVADKQDRFAPGSRSDFELVSKEYKNLLSEFNSGFNDKPYCYDYFENGTRISNTLRRIYSNYEYKFKNKNVFQENSDVYQFAKQNHLLSHGSNVRKNFKSLSTHSRFQTLIMICLKLALRVLGPDRYYMLMRYMAHVSSIQNQSKMYTVK